MQLLKGESSFWFNKQSFCKTKLVWQHEYYAKAVCESHLEEARNYILNQEAHHRVKTFREEMQELFPDLVLDSIGDYSPECCLFLVPQPKGTPT